MLDTVGVRRLVRADVALWVAWHQAVQDLPGNPYGVEIKPFGDAYGLCVHAIPLGYYNRLLGISDDRSDAFASAIEYFQEHFTPFRIDVNPFDVGVELLDRLAAAGFRPASFQTNLFARPIPLPSCRSKGIQVREVTEAEADEFAQLYDDAYNAGRPMSYGLAEFRRAAIRCRVGREGWHFFVATMAGRPVGGAVLHVNDGVASLSGGATISSMRGRGVQTALLNHRLVEAASHGCELVVSRCEVGTVSQRNMERVGLRTAYTKIIYEHGWSLTKTPPTAAASAAGRGTKRGTEGKTGRAVPAFPLVQTR